MLKISSSRWTTTVRISHLVIWRFRSKAPFNLRKVQNLVWVWGEVPGWFWSQLRCFDLLKCGHDGVWRHWMSGDQQRLDKELLGSLLTRMRFWRRRKGLWPTRLHCVISSGHLQGLFESLPVTLDIGGDESDDLPTIQKCLLLKFSFFCHFIFYVIVS